LAKELKKYEFDKIFIFNSSLRFNLSQELAGIKKIYQYPLFKKNNQHIVQAAKNLI
jgi:heptosyltransferase-2